MERPAAPPPERDRDLAGLEDAEAELADLERELRRVEHADEPPEG
jgi:hypothetical protein